MPKYDLLQNIILWNHFSVILGEKSVWLYFILKRACYICRMKKIIWMIVSGISLCAIPAYAQFNTIVTVPNRYIVETSRTGTDKSKPVSGSTASEKGASQNLLAEVSSDSIHKQMWIERYLSVSYPLHRIRINSPYGYRKDPFTGKNKFHNGIDLYAKGDEVLAMMEGVVVKAGQDKTSGKYVSLRHGNYVISYCHLSKICVTKGTAVHPRDVVGITGSTGRSTGEHLHITCKLNGKSIDPRSVLDYIKATQEKCVEALALL